VIAAPAPGGDIFIYPREPVLPLIRFKGYLLSDDPRQEDAGPKDTTLMYNYTRVSA
jgi:hypothetical protein